MRSRLCAVFVVAACSGGTPAGSRPTPARPLEPAGPTLAETGIVPDWLDRSVDPCTDFFEHACGTFVRTAVIPPDRSSWSAIQVVNKQAEELLRDVLEGAASDPGGDPGRKLIGDYYAACMDEEAIERAGTAPLAPVVQVIDKVREPAGARRAIIALHVAGASPFFSIYPTQDFADASQVIASLDQSGLGLPDRDYYLEEAGNMKEVRATYRAHVGKMLALAGTPAGEVDAATADVMRIETAIARLQQDKVLRRNPRAVYHKIDLAGLIKAAPSFPWKDYLAALGIGSVTAITVNDPAYFTGVTRLIAREKPAAIRHYLRMQLFAAYAPELGRELVAENFVMESALAGLKELPPRWRRCVDRTDRDLGQILAQAYVAVRFAGDAKQRAVELTRAVLDAMSAELDALPWMDATTRDAARRKLDKMGYLVGYPDVWRNYTFSVTRDSHAANVIAAAGFERGRQLAKMGMPVDRTDWQMTPPTVNAYYDSTLNQMVLPAGQLQPPFFGATFHPAVNFGGTGGSTIGHEMTHGFDDEGSQFDADGNLKNWWSEPTKKQFERAAQCVVDQYSQYDAVVGVKLNGKLTAGENIADIGGVKLGFLAYQAWRAKQPAPPPAKVEAYTDDQLYFLAYGQSWCAKETQERRQSRAHSDPHSPPMWRVNGVIVDQPGFAEAFHCPAGSPMNPGTTCSVW